MVSIANLGGRGIAALSTVARKLGARTSTRINNTALFFSLIASSLLVSSADALTYAGIDLPKPLSIDLDISADSYYVVRASQRHGDYTLSLLDKGTKRIVRQVDGTALKGLDELMLLSSNDCTKCVVVLDGVGNIDRASPYNISIDLIETGENHSATLELLDAITNANELNVLAREVEGDARDNYLKRMVKQLARAKQVVMNEQSASLRHSALTWLAETQFFLGRYDQQRKTLDQILVETQGTNSIYRSQALYEIAPLESDVEKERSHYDEGINIASQVGDKFTMAAGMNYKAVSLVRAGRYQEANSLLNGAYRIYSKSKSLRFLLDPLHNLSWANLRALNVPAAISYATQQKVLSERYEDEENTLWALYNLGLAYGRAGDRYVAEQFIDEALARHSELPRRIRGTLGALRAYLLQERTERLLDFGAIDAAADSAVQLKQALQQLGWPGRLADANFIQGEIALAQNDFTVARGKFLAALDYDTQNKRVTSAAQRLLRLAQLEIKEGNLIESSKFQTRALNLLSSTKEYDLLAKGLSQSVLLLHLMGADEDGLEISQQARYFVNSFGNERDRAAFLYHQAIVQSETKKLAGAIASLEAARGIIDSTLPKIRRPSLRRSYLALQKSIFELNVKLLIETSQDQTQSLVLIENFKARTLKEKIRQISSNRNVDTELMLERAQLLKDIREHATTWYSGKTGEQLVNSRNLSSALEKVEVKIETQRRLNRNTEIDAIDFNELQVNDNELIAYYFTGQEHSWLWVLTSKEQTLYPLPAQAELNSLTTAFLNNVSTAPANRFGGSAWEQVLAQQELSAVVAFPLYKHLANTRIRKITIVPDGPLHGVPFSALLLRESGKPIVNHYSLAYLPSLTVRRALTARNILKNRGENLSTLVIADPVGLENSSIPLSRLTHSTKEARTIQKLLGKAATLMMAKDANKSSFLELVSKPFRILHFATHGLLNDQNAALSGLVFSQQNDQENLWLTPEISTANINAELVVLSACNSAVGKTVSGEGLFSLSRAFIEGGASQVVGTLWQVEDLQTAELISEFYAQLINGTLSTSQALQLAQLSIYQNMNNDWKDPYYWAGFQLQGDGGILENGKG